MNLYLFNEDEFNLIFNKQKKIYLKSLVRNIEISQSFMKLKLLN